MFILNTACKIFSFVLIPAVAEKCSNFLISQNNHYITHIE